VRRRAALLFPLVVLTLALAGCGGSEEATPTPESVQGTLPAQSESTSTEEQGGGGGGEVEGDAEAGSQIYNEQGCGACHALEAANSTGNVGPDLDDLAPEYDAIVEQVTNGGGAMPPFKDSLSEQQIKDVSAFVFESTH